MTFADSKLAGNQIQVWLDRMMNKPIKHSSALWQHGEIVLGFDVELSATHE